MSSSKRIYKHKKKRHRSRRAFVSKICTLLIVLGSLCIAMGLVWVVTSLVVESTQSKKQLLIGFSYIVCGVLLILVKASLKLGVRLAEKRAMERSRLREARHHSPDNSRDGSVLILTLVLVALLSGLVLQAQVASRLSLEKTSTLASRTQLYLAAQDATLHAARLIAEDENPHVDHQDEAWATTREASLPGGISIRTKITDATSTFNVNNLAAIRNSAERNPESIMLDLLTLCGDYNPIDKVDTLKDWVDEDELGFRETAYYAEREPLQEPPNRVLYSWEELLLVQGFDKEYISSKEYEGGHIKHDNHLECLSVLPTPTSQPTPVNINTVRRSVLTSILGMNLEHLADLLITMRNIKPIPSMATAQMAADDVDLSPFLPYLDIKSNFFRIETRAFQDGGSLDLTALVQRTKPGELEVIQWIF